MRNDNAFISNRDGAMSIEFAACVVLFTITIFVIYDIYSTIMLQNRLERVNYTVASVFRERSELYPLIDDTKGGNSQFSLCSKSGNSCFSTHEIFTQEQVDEIGQLASTLLDRPVSVNVDSLFILQDVDFAGDLSKATLTNLQTKTCPNDQCSTAIDNYFQGLPTITDNSALTLNDYSKLVPYVERKSSTTVPGRWIPLYRVSMCIANEESLYLRWINSDRKSENFLPNLCSDVVVLSRCNNLRNTDHGCPIYFR